MKITVRNAVVSIVLTMLMISGVSAQNKWYPVNKAPLKQTKFVTLPVSAVKPLGWLQGQCKAMANGLTGHLYELDPSPDDDIANFIKNSQWRGGNGDRWEAGVYYLNGLLPLAYILDDQRLIDETKKWITTMLANPSWFASTGGDQNAIWGSTMAWKCLRAWYEVNEAAGTPDSSKFFPLTRTFFNLLKTAQWGSDWSWARGEENILATTWFHRRTGEQLAIDVAGTVKTKSMDWTTLYKNMKYNNLDLRYPSGWCHWAHVVNHGMAVKWAGIFSVYPAATADDASMALAACDKMLKYHGQVGNSFSGDESIAGGAPWHGTETCGIVEQMFSYENMIEVFGTVELADRLEQITYNKLPGQMTPDGWNRQYHGQVNQVLVNNAPRSWMSSGNAANNYGNFNWLFRCCTCNLHQGWPWFVVNTWMASQDNGLVAITYAPTVVTAKVGDNGQKVTITEETEYPFKNKVTFKITTSAAVSFPLVLRVPKWGKGTVVVAAGAQITGAGSPSNLDANQWVTVTKTWNNNDQVTVTLPFNIRKETYYGAFSASSGQEVFSKKYLGIARGPLFFCLKPQSTWTTERTYRNAMGAKVWNIASDGKWNYALMLDTAKMDACFTPVERAVSTAYPFGHNGDMVYDATANNFKALTQDAPVSLLCKGKRVASWILKSNSADDVPASPMTGITTTSESLELIPYGCARLRIAGFPYIDSVGWTSISQSAKTGNRPAMLVQQKTSKGLLVIVNTDGNHRVDLIALSGKLVKSFCGTGKARYILSDMEMRRGVYVMRLSAGSEKRIFKCIMH